MPLGIKLYVLKLSTTCQIFTHFKDFPKAEKYANESLELARKNNDSYMISVAGITLADILILQGKYDKQYLL